MERPSVVDGPPEGRHRAARLRTARSAGGVQAGIVHALRRDDGALRTGDGARSVPDARGGRKRRRDQLCAGRQTAAAQFGSGSTAEFRADGGASRAPQRVQTSLDDVERQFQRRKERELQQARRAGAGQQEGVQQVVRGEKVGRNDPCPCGSGKKYKKCHGANE